MTRYGDDRARARHTPASAPKGDGLRDLTDTELSEAIDSDRDEADRALLYGWTWCPACDAWTLDSTCRFCGARTFSEKPSPSTPGVTSAPGGSGGNEREAA